MAVMMTGVDIVKLDKWRNCLHDWYPSRPNYIWIEGGQAEILSMFSKQEESGKIRK